MGHDQLDAMRTEVHSALPTGRINRSGKPLDRCGVGQRSSIGPPMVPPVGRFGEIREAERAHPSVRLRS
jgi:hypothetical protein